MSDSSWPHGPEQGRPSCLPLPPGVWSKLKWILLILVSLPKLELIGFSPQCVMGLEKNKDEPTFDSVSALNSGCFIMQLLIFSLSLCMCVCVFMYPDSDFKTFPCRHAPSIIFKACYLNFVTHISVFVTRATRSNHLKLKYMLHISRVWRMVGEGGGCSK